MDVLAANSTSNTISPPVTPIQNEQTARTQSPLVFDTPTTPITPGSDDSKCSDISNSSKKVTKKSIVSINEGDFKPSNSRSDVNLVQECVFVVPDKPETSGASSSRMINVIRSGQTRSDSEASSIHMEVDETSQCTEKGGNTDIDSGIENMEVRIKIYV